VRRSLGCFQVLISLPTIGDRQDCLGIGTMLSPELTRPRGAIVCNQGALTATAFPAKPPSLTRLPYSFVEDFWFSDPFFHCFCNANCRASPRNFREDLHSRSKNGTNLAFWLSWHIVRPEIGA